MEHRMMDFKSKYAQVRAARQHALAEYTAAAKRQREEERKKYADALQGLRKRVAACISAAKPHMGCCDYRVSLDMVEGNSTRPVGALTVIIQELRDAG